jgi:hypothetical protein
MVLRAMLAAPLVASCTTTPPPPPTPDPLAALAARARADADTAAAIAPAVPALREAAIEITKARSEHALALQREVDRERPPKSSTPPSAVTVGPAAPDPVAAKATLVDGLTAAEKEAAELLASLPRYRAGLIGSVAAGCASLREVIG